MKSQFYIKKSDFILEHRNNNYSYYITNDIRPLPHIHYHIEIIYVINGEVSVTVDGKTSILKTEDAATIFPHQIHYGNCITNSQILYLIFTPDFVPSLKSSIISHIPISCFFKRDDMSNLSKLSIKTCCNILKKESIDSNNDTFVITKDLTTNELLTFSGIIQIFISDFFNTHELKTIINDNNASTFKIIFDYIDKNLTSGLTLESTAHALGLNSFYLSRLFSNNLGITFVKYVSRKKLFLAYDMVLNTDKTITEIMYATGFKSERTFYRSFKELFGTTPLHIRKNQIQGILHL